MSKPISKLGKLVQQATASCKVKRTVGDKFGDKLGDKLGDKFGRKAGYDVLSRIQDGNSNVSSHVRYIADNKLVFAAHLAKHEGSNEFCSAFIAVGPDGRVAGLGVDRQAFPKECYYIPKEIAQQITTTLVGFAASGIVESPEIALCVSRQEASKSGLFGLLPACNMHHDGNMLVGRPLEVVEGCKQVLYHGTQDDDNNNNNNNNNNNTAQKFGWVATTSLVWLDQPK